MLCPRAHINRPSSCSLSSPESRHRTPSDLHLSPSTTPIPSLNHAYFPGFPASFLNCCTHVHRSSDPHPAVHASKPCLLPYALPTNARRPRCLPPTWFRPACLTRFQASYAMPCTCLRRISRFFRLQTAGSEGVGCAAKSGSCTRMLRAVGVRQAGRPRAQAAPPLPYTSILHAQILRARQQRQRRAGRGSGGGPGGGL